jgi:glycosyltransferase involved in cell wall biosynthesis
VAESAITVVIPARDAAAALPATLDALRGADVVVVDNGSRDDTAAVALAHGARVVREPRRSRARARNAGAAASTRALLAFLDADCVPSPRWLPALAEALETDDLAGGPIEWRTGATPNRVERFDVAWRAHVRRTGGFTGSGNLAIRREVFERLDGFDPAFRAAGEDSDLARRAGSPVRFVPEAVVTHAAEATLKGLVARGFRHGFGNAQMRRRHGPEAGRAYWRHPRPVVAGDWALRRFDIEDRGLLAVARVDYAARVAGSLWADVRRVR